MTHFGILSLAATGHLNTMFPLGYELKRRGHKVTFLSNSEAQILVHRAGFNFIAEACADLDAQLVISLGGGLDPEALANLPGNPLVVKYAPQLELLQKASLNITHAGLNTTLESLSYGVPMVAIPVTDDQPGVTARIAWTGVGELVTLSRLNVNKMQKTIEKVLKEQSYKQNAVRLQEAIRRTKGVYRAVDIIEQAVST